MKAAPFFIWMDRRKSSKNKWKKGRGGGREQNKKHIQKQHSIQIE